MRPKSRRTNSREQPKSEGGEATPQSAEAPKPSSDLAQQKLRAEILKLRMERVLLRRQLQRGNLPTWWDVVKTVVPWVSVAIGALAFATGYVQSLRQERQKLLQVAMDLYLGNHPEVGASLLRELTRGESLRFPWPLSLLSPTPPDVPTYLIQGIELDDENTDLHWRRNLAALEILADLGPDNPELLEKKYSDGQRLLEDQLLAYTPQPEPKDTVALQLEIERTVEFLCKTGSFLDEQIINRHGTWTSIQPEHLQFLKKEWQSCICCPPGTGSSGATPDSCSELGISCPLH